MVHHPHADGGLHRQHQAGEERAAVVGRSSQARVQEHHRLPRSALDRRRAGGRLRRQFRERGDMSNLQPGFDYFTKLQQTGNVLRVLGTTPYAQFVKGEIPIWISYENDGLKSKYTDGLGDAVQVVIPKEASAAAPYAISLVDKGPNPNTGKLWLNFIMTDMGQGIFAQGFVRPSVPGVKLPDNVADKLPAAPQVRPLDVKTAAAKKADVDKGWAAATGSK